MSTPPEELRAAAASLRETAAKATPGPWERPLNVRNKACVLATLPADEEPHTWKTGIDPQTGQRERVTVATIPIWSDGKHMRKRNGRDLEWIALMHPGVAEPLATLLESVADEMESHGAVEGTASKAVHAVSFLGLGGPRADWTAALAVARAVNGTRP